jgi:hypothetical protein
MPVISRRITTRTGESVISDMTDREAVQAVCLISDLFAQDLARRSHGNELKLSDEQIKWCHVLVIHHRDKQVEKAEPKPVVPVREIEDLSKLNAMFDAAEQHMTYPRVRLMFKDKRPIAIWRPIKYQDVRDGLTPALYRIGDGKRKMYAAINTKQEFQRGNLNDADADELYEIITQLAADPVIVAAGYGQVIGSCSFCGLALTDLRSLSTGYGPICARNWGLPWGEEMVARRADDLVEKLRREMEG